MSILGIVGCVIGCVLLIVVALVVFVVFKRPKEYVGDGKFD